MKQLNLIDEYITNFFFFVQRTASSSSFGSFDSNSASLTPSSSSNIIDLVLEPENSSPAKHPEISAAPFLLQTSSSTLARSQDSFSLPIMQQPIPYSSSFTDVFAVNHQSSSTIPSEEKLTIPLSDSVGWATFDLPYQANNASELSKDPASMVSQANKQPVLQNATDDLFLSFADQHNEIASLSDPKDSSQVRTILVI